LQNANSLNNKCNFVQCHDPRTTTTSMQPTNGTHAVPAAQQFIMMG